MFTLDEALKATGGRLLQAGRSGPAAGVSIDSRTMKPRDIFIAIRGDRFDGHDFIGQASRRGCPVIIVQEDTYARVLRRNPRLAGETAGSAVMSVKDTVKALGDLARRHRMKFDIPVAAVTGSNGKTTTKELIACLLSGRFRVLKNEGTRNNHIGVPLTLLSLNCRHGCVVVELGTNHPGEIAYLAGIAHPTLGVITNIGPAHLQHFKTLAGVMKEKHSLSGFLLPPSVLVVNADDALLRRSFMTRPSSSHIAFGFGVRNKSDFTATDLRISGGTFSCTVNEAHRFRINTRGAHNISNSLAAIAVARILGVAYADAARRLKYFEFLPDRLSFVKTGNARFINDTYNANPVSLKAALDTLAQFRTQGRKILVMGDMMELGAREVDFHRRAGRDIARSCDTLIAVGNLSRHAAEEARLCGVDPANIFTCASAPEARDILFKRIRVRPDDVVLVKGARAMKMETVIND